MKNEKMKEGFISLSSSILAILIGLIFGFFILLISNPQNAVAGMGLILKGGVENGSGGIVQTINYAIPIIMTGLSVGLSFKAGLFNIGASGQFTMGSFIAILVGVNLKMPGGIHWLAAVLLAVLAGALWGAIPGFLKAHFNVNEVIACIMTNYIALYLVNMLIPAMGIYDQMRNQTFAVNETAMNPKGIFEILLPNTNLDMGIIIVIVAVILMYILLEKTVLGFEIKACGKNPNAAKYSGINEKRMVITTMMISGALSGLGGALMYLGYAGKFMRLEDIIALEGFNGISTALLGASHPIGTLFAGIFISHITMGGYNMQILNYVPEIIDMIVAAIIYCGAFALLFKLGIGKILGKNDNQLQINEQAAKLNDKEVE